MGLNILKNRIFLVAMNASSTFLILINDNKQIDNLLITIKNNHIQFIHKSLYYNSKMNCSLLVSRLLLNLSL